MTHDPNHDKLTGHLPGPGPLRETWLRAMLDEV